MHKTRISNPATSVCNSSVNQQRVPSSKFGDIEGDAHARDMNAAESGGRWSSAAENWRLHAVYYLGWTPGILAVAVAQRSCRSILWSRYVSLAAVFPDWNGDWIDLVHTIGGVAFPASRSTEANWILSHAVTLSSKADDIQLNKKFISHRQRNRAMLHIRLTVLWNVVVGGKRGHSLNTLPWKMYSLT